MHLRRIPWIAILLIVVLRIAIGWQLFYEGLWKTKTLSSPKPWTSEGYLRNSQGPLRTTFRNMTGDPNDMNWLNAKKVEAKWRDWESRFSRHYQLNKTQNRRLRELVRGKELKDKKGKVRYTPFYSDKGAIEAVPDGVDLSKVSVIDFDAENKRLTVNGQKHISGGEVAKILKMLPETPEGETDPEDIAAFKTQLNKVYLRSSRLSYIEKMRGQLIGNSDVAGSKNKEGELQQLGELQKYKGMIAGYEKNVAMAKQAFQHEHLKKSWGDLQKQRTSLIGPIKALEADMEKDAEKLLTLEQMQKHGDLGDRWTGLRIADTITILGLTLCGFCLIIGLFTRFSALMAAIMLFSFYLAMPPLPGLPEAPGPEHSLVVNKNLIEVFALAAIATLPSGYWFGLDKVVTSMWRKFRGKADPDDE